MILWSILPGRTPSMRPQRLLFLLVVIFIGLACYYSITTPTFESPDEIWHYQFIRVVAVNRGLPVVIPEQTSRFDTRACNLHFITRSARRLSRG